ncbi:hypothetical protein HU200_052949 [Digitaria exilis]|uniref:Uncharacterized protein n=1 Tax=Digitaria exilis TaxID=1010633 RepID=A0A835E8V4_9POAL|nr:hypothetical protein HU200_052949 [Digitaria exilis]
MVVYVSGDRRPIADTVQVDINRRVVELISTGTLEEDKAVDCILGDIHGMEH